jgi:hypothetical protein
MGLFIHQTAILTVGFLAATYFRLIGKTEYAASVWMDAKESAGDLDPDCRS